MSDVYNLKDSERLFTTMFSTWCHSHGWDNLHCFYTLPPNKDRYNDFVGAAYKIVYFPPSGAEGFVVCYVFFRLTRAPRLEQPRLSSIEIFTAAPYMSWWKRHLSDYVNPLGVIIEAVYNCLLKLPPYLGSIYMDFKNSLPKSTKGACVKAPGVKRKEGDLI